MVQTGAGVDVTGFPASCKHPNSRQHRHQSMLHLISGAAILYSFKSWDAYLSLLLCGSCLPCAAEMPRPQIDAAQIYSRGKPSVSADVRCNGGRNDGNETHKCHFLDCSSCANSTSLGSCPPPLASGGTTPPWSEEELIATLARHLNRAMCPCAKMVAVEDVEAKDILHAVLRNDRI